jgi:hypothetical protein
MPKSGGKKAEPIMLTLPFLKSPHAINRHTGVILPA